MADELKSATAADAPAPSAERDRGPAGAASPPSARRPLPAPRKLTHTELEALRSRLQKAFH